MLFNSFKFLWLFPALFILYYGLCTLTRHKSKLFRRKFENFALIFISYALYAQFEPVYALLLLAITAVTFLFALLIECKHAYGEKKYIVFSGVTLALFPLLLFKYYNFLSESMANMLAHIGIRCGLPGLNLAIPIGISFFSFQAVGYLFDVYRQNIKAEHNWWNYMLFVCFFPQITSGPISKAKDLLPQIKHERLFDYDLCVQGMKWLLWGFFMKTVVADRLGLYVDKVFETYQYQTGGSCLVASLFYSFQIYADFAGYSLMAIGVGAIMGFNLVNNFRRPYLSVSVTDFWRRWHISLSTWLKDYIYIPLGGSRCSKTRNYFNIFITFLVSGIWHGANWTFILWGVIHGVVQIFEKFFGVQKYERKDRKRLFRILGTFIVVTFAWIFFRMPSIGDAFGVIEKIITDPVSAIFKSNNTNAVLTIAAIVTIIAKEITEEFTGFSLFNNKHTIVRWISYLIVIFSILLFGVLDSTQFIYASF